MKVRKIAQVMTIVLELADKEVLSSKNYKFQ